MIQSCITLWQCDSLRSYSISHLAVGSASGLITRTDIYKIMQHIIEYVNIKWKM